MKKSFFKFIHVFLMVAMIAWTFGPSLGILVNTASADGTANLVLTVPAATTITRSALVTETNGTASDAAVTAAINGLAAIPVTLENTGGDVSNNVRISPIGADSHIQLWAQDSDSHWFDINVTGWIDSAGMAVPAGQSFTTSVYAISDVAGSYTLTVNLVNVSDFSSAATPVTGTVTVTHTSADFRAFDGVANGTDNYTVSSGITTTYDSGTGTENDPVMLKVTGNAPIVIPWFQQANWSTTNNYVAIGIKLPANFVGTSIDGGTAVYQADVMRYDFPTNGDYTVDYGNTPLATEGAAHDYLNYEFAANSINTKNSDGIVKLKVIWTVNSEPEYFSIDVSDLQLDTPTHKFISTIEQLRGAIESQDNNQNNNQIWTISAGDYGLDRFTDITVQEETGWYFPITANNVTIEGQGNPVIYGKEYSANSNLSTQNLITVFGDNVIIKGLVLMTKVDGNKTIEVLGDDFTIENTTIEPNTKVAESVYNNINETDRAFSKEWGGSIYFNHAGTHTVKNVTINNGGISFRYSPSGTHITFDTVNIVNTTAIDEINGYRYSSGFNNSDNTINGAPKVTYNVNSTLNNLDSALAGAQNDDVLNINSDLTAIHQINITKALTINGNDHTIIATSEIPNNSAVIAPSVANGLTISDLTVDGAGIDKLHGINAFKSTMDLNDVTVKNNTKSGIVVNSSQVTVNSITTLNNTWNGIDVDQNETSSAWPSKLTINGTSTHTEAGPDIFIDDIMKPVSVVDTNHQYSHIDTGNARTFTLLAVGQTTPDENGVATVTNTNKDVVVNSTASTTITIPENVKDATIDVKSLPSFTDNGGTTNTTATLPAITLNVATSLSTTPVKVEIPTGTVVTAPAGWDGTIYAPTIKDNSTVTATADSGKTATVNSVIEVGYGDVKLTFDKAVRIFIPGQGGKYVGYSRSNIFTEITNICNTDTEDTTIDSGATFPAEGDCKMDSVNGLDLIIWTKHFTTFATYTQTTNPVASTGGGGYYQATCSDVTYSEWGNVFNGLQYRTILSQTPTYCSLSSSQIAAESRPYVAVVEPVEPQITPDTETPAQTPTTTKEVLGVKIYADGTLLKGTNNKIYVVNGNALVYIPNLKELAKYTGPVLKVDDATISSFAMNAVLGAKKFSDGTLLKGTNNKIYVVDGNALVYIPNLKELAKYTGPILKVDDATISSFATKAVLGAKKYADGTLLKAKGDVKIYVIKDGKKVHIKSLVELKQYKGKTFTVDASELNNY